MIVFTPYWPHSGLRINHLLIFKLYPSQEPKISPVLCQLKMFTISIRNQPHNTFDPFWFGYSSDIVSYSDEVLEFWQLSKVLQGGLSHFAIQLDVICLDYVWHRYTM